MTTRTETITAPDGGTFAGHLVLPESGSGPGLLVLQEIFGVNEYIRDVCERVAALGYVALAPDVFWRIEPGVEVPHTEEGLGQAYALIGQYDAALGAGDLAAALEHLRALPECDGRAGALGFCFGGTTSFGLALGAAPDTVVSYYGSGVASMLSPDAEPACPVLFHFGANDPFLPMTDVDRVNAWAAGRVGVEVAVQASGHAFDNSFNPMFSDPPAAQAAWERTLDFLARTLPVG
jgi:carboxymethylenebutenolidase